MSQLYGKIIYFLGISPAAPGESCEQFCKKIELPVFGNFSCEPKLRTHNNTLLFEEAGLECNDSESQSVYSKAYHPSYNVEGSRCEGFESVPEELDCESTADGYTLRICNCISPCKYLDFSISQKSFL